MNLKKLKPGHFVQIEFGPYNVCYYEVLELKESDSWVRLRNIKSGEVSNHSSKHILDIPTKPVHLKKIGFKEVEIKNSNPYHSHIQTKYVFNNIEIIDFGYHIRSKPNGTELPVISRYSPFEKPYDLAEIIRELLEGTMSEVDLDGYYPSLRYLNSLFDYLDKMGIVYDKKEVVLAGR